MLWRRGSRRKGALKSCQCYLRSGSRSQALESCKRSQESAHSVAEVLQWSVPDGGFQKPSISSLEPSGLRPPWADSQLWRSAAACSGFTSRGGGAPRLPRASIHPAAPAPVPGDTLRAGPGLILRRGRA